MRPTVASDITAILALLLLQTNRCLWHYGRMLVLNDPDELGMDEIRGIHGDIKTFYLVDEILRQKSLFSKTDEMKFLLFRLFAENLFSGRNYFVYIAENMRLAVIFKIFVRLKSQISIFAEKFRSFLEKSSSRRNPTADRVKLPAAPETTEAPGKTAPMQDLVFPSDCRTEVKLSAKPEAVWDAGRDGSIAGFGLSFGSPGRSRDFTPTTPDFEPEVKIYFFKF